VAARKSARRCGIAASSVYDKSSLAAHPPESRPDSPHVFIASYTKRVLGRIEKRIRLARQSRTRQRDNKASSTSTGQEAAEFTSARFRARNVCACGAVSRSCRCPNCQRGSKNERRGRGRRRRRQWPTTNRLGSGIRLDRARSDCPRLAITKRIANLSEAALIRAGRGSLLPPSTPSLDPSACTRCIRGRRSAVIAERAAARGAPISRTSARETLAGKILGKLDTRAREDGPDKRKMRSAFFFLS